jgi:uncharacterized protein
MRVQALVVLLTMLVAVAPARGESVFEDLNRELTDRVIVPGYQRFAATPATLETAVSGFCAEPTPERLQAARRAFEEAMLAWQRVQPIVFGPIAAGARSSGSSCFQTEPAPSPGN